MLIMWNVLVGIGNVFWINKIKTARVFLFRDVYRTSLKRNSEAAAGVLFFARDARSACL
jgi:hypothetical protein